MKRSILTLSVLVLAFAGCNTCGSWRPNFGGFKSCLHGGASNVGAPCDAGCEAGQADGCQSCGQAGSANYGGYGETVIGSYETPMSSSVSGSVDGISIGSTLPSGSVPSGSSLPPGSFSGGTSPIRGETIRPKPAN